MVNVHMGITYPEKGLVVGMSRHEIKLYMIQLDKSFSLHLYHGQMVFLSYS